MHTIYEMWCDTHYVTWFWCSRYVRFAILWNYHKFTFISQYVRWAPDYTYLWTMVAGRYIRRHQENVNHPILSTYFYFFFRRFGLSFYARMHSMQTTIYSSQSSFMCMSKMTTMFEILMDHYAFMGQTYRYRHTCNFYCHAFFECHTNVPLSNMCAGFTVATELGRNGWCAPILMLVCVCVRRM